MTFTPESPVAWAEISVSDLPSAVAFYNRTFGYDMQIVTDMGPMPMAVFPMSEAPGGVSGNLIQGTPGGGTRVHLAVADTVEAARARARAAGGLVGDEVYEIPPGRYAYATDPDGNRIGLFQPKG